MLVSDFFFVIFEAVDLLLLLFLQELVQFPILVLNFPNQVRKVSLELQDPIIHVLDQTRNLFDDGGEFFLQFVCVFLQ